MSTKKKQEYAKRVTGMAIGAIWEPLFSELNTTIEIADEGGGEFLTVAWIPFNKKGGPSLSRQEPGLSHPARPRRDTRLKLRFLPLLSRTAKRTG